jgi:membrane associated rhomboid family serine protease
VLAVFHSSAEELAPHTMDLPFATVGDPHKVLYREVGARSSVRGVLAPRAWPTIARALGVALVGLLRGSVRPPRLRPEGGRFGLPADLLLGPSGVVLATKYGERVDDHRSSSRSLSHPSARRNPPRLEAHSHHDTEAEMLEIAPFPAPVARSHTTAPLSSTGAAVPAPDVRSAISTAPVDAVLIAINVAVFAAISLDTRLLDVLALPPTWLGVSDQPWTVLTAFFTSEVLIHLAVAVLVIGLFGMRFERVAGSMHALIVYLLAGLAGSLALVATAAWMGSNEPSVGASAAFLGLVGALATSPRAAWGDKLAIDKVVVVVVIIQFVGPAIAIGDWTSSAAHIAGLAVGAAYGYLLRLRMAGELPGAARISRP